MKLVHAEGVTAGQVSHNPDIVRRVLLSGDSLPASLRLSLAEFPPGATAPAHTHPDLCEIFYFIAGEGLATLDGVAHPIRAGHCLQVDPGEMHEIANTGSGSMQVLYFALPASPRR